MLNLAQTKILHPRGNFETYLDQNEKSRWRIVSSNGDIIGASSQWFSSESYCEENAKLVMQGIAEYLKKESLPKKPIILGLRERLLLNRIAPKTIIKPVFPLKKKTI